MWPDSRTEYVLWHFRCLYELTDVEIGYGKQDCSVVIPDSGKSFFQEKNVSPPYRMWEGIPILFFNEESDKLYEVREKKLFYKVDFIAAIFFQLSGWQEVCAGLPHQSRFLAKDSWQGKNGFERLPLVNLYFKLMAEGISHFLGKEVKLKNRTRKPIVFLSHDIDKIMSGRWEGGFNALKDLDMKRLLKAFTSFRDPWHNLLDIARLERSHGAKSTFFFLAKKGRVNGGFNSDYRIRSKSVQHDISYLSSNSWEVAVHGTLGSHLNSSLLSSNRNEVNPKAIGNRFHFLNFSIDKTISVLEESGFSYDSSLGFADRVGFRNGISSPFRLYNWKNECASKVLEIPLMVMDTTLYHSKYMNLSTQEALEVILELFTNAVKSGGIFSLLWHNNFFSDLKYKGWREVYLSFLEEVKGCSEFLTGQQIYKLYEPL